MTVGFNKGLLDLGSGASGTWTPSVRGSGTAGTGYTYLDRYGIYRLIGDVCICTCNVQWDNGSGGTSNIEVYDLPFTALNVADYQAIGAAQCALINFPGTVLWGSARVVPNTKTVRIAETNQNAAWTDSNWESEGQLKFTVTYIIET